LTNRDSGNIKGMDLILNKRFSNNFALNLQYTLQFSRTTGSQAGTGFYDRLDPATGEAFREPDELNPIDNDRTHQFSGQVNYMFPEDFQSGTLAGDILKNFRTFAVLRMHSGVPGSGSSLGGLVYGTNYFRGRWFTDLTLRFTKTFRLAKATRLDVFAEIFNATNRKNLVPYPSNEKFEWYDNRPGTGGKTLTWSDDLHPDQKVLFNADFNGDGILTVDESALGGIAHDVMDDIMDKRDWGYARMIHAGVGLSF